MDAFEIGKLMAWLLKKTPSILWFLFIWSIIATIVVFAVSMVAELIKEFPYAFASIATLYALAQLTRISIVLNQLYREIYGMRK